ncbi:polysaccharide pyruvyl transferase family protein [Mucilaginibacter pedocola]|uniref:Polysaccharide pyruvyl transferase domain-containing protein n=1 Tax=Mucilaginibacter pedocola TaxID=1792845 RepID=A0A1S9PE86_9SPHI|nr:polysaccharide pyruvyl transferase family protein [Mucilaginibacter pedocola]OOQ59260.1 hypothetical protein BC343_28480 [Mucilaginibacter pedocola]
MGLKKGVLIYESGYRKDNVGDYVQSLAALQFLGGKADVYLNRELLNEYTGEEVVLIMNGWFTHHPKNWPPAKSILPYFISFHLNVLAQEHFLNTPQIVDYLKQYAPIGCRDRKTAEVLNAKGIDAYFSGCLTLTLGETFTDPVKERKAYFVDTKYEPIKRDSSLIGFTWTLLTKYNTIKTISQRRSGFTNLRWMIRAASFYKSYSPYFTDEVLTQAEYIKHADPLKTYKDEDEKFEYARELLRKYAKAAFVVTSRVHCALPSVGMGTPAIYVNDLKQDEVSFCRMDGLLELFNLIDFEDGKLTPRFNWGGGKIGFDTKLSNSPAYLKLKQGLMEKVKSFVAKHNIA